MQKFGSFFASRIWINIFYMKYNLILTKIIFRFSLPRIWETKTLKLKRHNLAIILPEIGSFWKNPRKTKNGRCIRIDGKTGMMRITLLPRLMCQTPDEDCQTTAQKRKTKVRFFATLMAKKIITLVTASNSRKIQKTSSDFSNLCIKNWD